MTQRAKCPRCGALLMADATWCGQCFLNFRRVFRAPREAPPLPPRPAGPLGPLAALFLTAAATVYAFSAIDAGRLANGDPQILSPRIVLYGSAALVILSVASLFVLVVHASHIAHSLKPNP